MKILLITLSFTLMNIITYAQVPTYQWVKTSGTSSSSEGRGISTDANGNVFITGYFSSPTITFGTTTLTLTSTFGINIFIVKYDVTGNVLWAKNAGGTGIGSIGFSISNDGIGNIFLTGVFKDPTITFGNITVNNSGFNNSNIFIAKYDSNGNVLWAKNVGSMYLNGYGYGISNDASGNVFITGWFDSDITIGSTTLINAGGFSGGSDIFIAKYDTNGNVLWAKRAGGTSVDEAYGISTDVAGNVYITGEFSSSTIAIGTTTLTNTLGSGGDIFIAKYDTNGNTLWAKSAGGFGGDHGRGISADTNGNVFITGSFQASTITFGTTTLTNSGYSNILIAKYDTNGNTIWAKNAISTATDYGLAICTDGFGAAYITGEFSSDTISFGNNTLINKGDRDTFIAKYDANGNAIWADNIGGASLESGYGIATDLSGDVFVTGRFYSPSITFGNTTLTNNSGYFLTKLSRTTGIEIIQKETSISIAPNPFTYQTTINFKEERINTSIKILDILGKVIKEFKFTGKELVIEKGTMQEGIYFVQTADELNHISTKKIIIQ